MKLHLPKGLRMAMLKSVAVAATLAATVGSSAYGYRVDVPYGGHLYADAHEVAFAIAAGADIGDGSYVLSYSGEGEKGGETKHFWCRYVLNAEESGEERTITLSFARTNEQGTLSDTSAYLFDFASGYTTLKEGVLYVISHSGGNSSASATLKEVSTGNVIASFTGKNCNMNGADTSTTTRQMLEYFNDTYSPGDFVWAGTGESAALDYTSSNWTNSNAVDSTTNTLVKVTLVKGADIVLNAGETLAKNLTIGSSIYVDTVKVNDNYTLTGTSADAKLDASTITIANDKTLTLTSTTGNAISVKGNVTGGKLQVDSAVSFEAGNISSIIQGSGSVTKAGSGTLTLSGANTYTGGTTISGGELVVNNNSALGTGMVTVQNGAILNANNKKDAMAAIAGVTLQAGATLKNVGNGMWANESQLSTLILEGDATINASARFGLVSTTGTGNSMTWNDTSLQLNGKTLTISGGQGFVFAETKTSDGDTGIINVTSKIFFGHDGRGDTSNLSGATISLAQNAEMHVEHNNAKVTVAGLTGSGSVTNGGEIIINGSDAYVFSGVIKDFTNDTEVRKGSLIKTGTGTLTLSGANTYTGGTTIEKGILALSGNGTLGTGLVTIKKDGTLKTNGSAATMTVTGAGAIDLGNKATLYATLDSNWTGTVKMSGATLSDANLNGYGNANSCISLSGVSGSLATGTVASDILLGNSGTQAALKITSGAAQGEYTFTGDIKNLAANNTGNVVITGSAVDGMTFKFSGDTSGWTGNMVIAEDGGSQNITFTGNATTVNNAVIAAATGQTNKSTTLTFDHKAAATVNSEITNNYWNRKGTLNISVTNTAEEGTTFTKKVKADSIAVNNGTKATFKEQTETATLTVGKGASAKFTNANVKLTDVTMDKGASLAITAAKTLTFQNLTLADGTTINPKAAATLVDAAEATTNVSITVSKKASFGADATINADLTLANGATVEMAKELTLGGTLTLSTGLTLGGDLYTAITSMTEKSEAIVLFTGVTELLGVDALTRSGEINFSTYFTNVTSETGTYELYYNEGTVSVAFTATPVVAPDGGETDIPEPTTGALSLIGLAALAMRRRRK